MAGNNKKVNFSFREATLDDYEAVMAIDKNIYDGVDYLPKMYHIYMRDPRRTGFVLESHGKIIAFAMSYVIDDQETYVVQAARICQDMRKAGLWASFGRQVSQATTRKFPSLIKVAVTSYERELMLSKIQSREIYWQFSWICTRRIILASLKFGSNPTIEKGLTSPIKKIEPNALQSILMDPETQWKLFPHRRIFISWEPFRIIPSNIEIIGKLCYEIIGTPDDKDPARFSTISFGHYYEVKNGLRYNIEIYSNDEQEVLDHVRKQIQLSYKYHTYGKHNIWIYVPIHIDEEIVKRELENNQPIDGELGSHPMCLFEKDIRPTPKSLI